MNAIGSAQPLPGHIAQTGPTAHVPAASRPTDVTVAGRGGALSPTVLDSTEIAVAMLEIERAEIDVFASTVLQRLIPRVTFAASFGIGDVIFRDPLSDAITVLPRDSYRLTFTLGLDQILRSPDHERALLRLRTSELDLARVRVQVLQRQVARRIDEAAAREELVLLSDELTLVRQLVAYNETLFAEGRTEFDALARAKLQLLNLSRVIHQVSQRLAKTN